MSSRTVRLVIVVLVVAVVGLLTAGTSQPVDVGPDGPVVHYEGLAPQHSDGPYGPVRDYADPAVTPGGWVTAERLGARWPHPVETAQAGLYALNVGDVEGARDRGHGLTNMVVDDWWLPYWFDWHVRPAEMNAPWVSSMAQGQALSLFVRLYETTGEPQWLDAAERTWATLQVRRDDGGSWWSQRVVNGRMWFDEYPDGNTFMVVNGHVFAMFGVYDWWRVTGDPEAVRLFDEAASTALHAFREIRRPGEVSVYCVGCGWGDDLYHQVHIDQLEVLAAITGDARFGDLADLYRSDA